MPSRPEGAMPRIFGPAEGVRSLDALSPAQKFHDSSRPPGVRPLYVWHGQPANSLRRRGVSMTLLEMPPHPCDKNPRDDAMTQQLSFGLSGDSEASDYLFFCIFPEPPPAALTLAGYAQQLRSKHGLSGRPLAPERFHISLFDLGHSSGLNVGRVREAVAAAATVRASAFDVAFDSVMSFGRNASKLPLVLRSGLTAGPLVEFHRTLGLALRRAGLRVRPQFTPHITLLYDSKSIPQEPIEPFRFRVTQFTLVHSLQGETQHVKLAQWTLQDEATGRAGEVRSLDA